MVVDNISYPNLANINDHIENTREMTSLFESFADAIKKTLSPLTDIMYNKNDYPMIDKTMEKIEKSTNIKREKLAYGLLTFFAIYFVIGALAQVVVNLVGFIYPAWSSIRAVRSISKEDDTQWLIYWIVFASFSLIDLSIFSAIPFYWLIKVVFLMYLYLPAFKGANFIYSQYIDPFCSVIEAFFTSKAKDS